MKPQHAITKQSPNQLHRGGTPVLLKDLRDLILSARQSVAQAMNAALTTLYWQVGDRLRKDILRERRAEYGERIVPALGTQLSKEFGRGFAARNLFRMIRFAEVFPDFAIVSPARAQFVRRTRRAFPEEYLKRDFYAEMCRIERWSTRTLEKKISSLLFERTALSRKPAKLAEMELKALRENDRLTPDLVFRDPYLLDFLGLKNTYAEKDMEAAILREMEAFILELGGGFCFVERQKRMQIDDEDYYLDLLFYHRKLRRLVAVDLKLGKFAAADMGQMELYLQWLKKYEKDEGERDPLGIILCAGKREQHVELLEVEKSGIHVASYLTEVLPKRDLERRLRDAVRLARGQLANAREEKSKAK